MKSNCAVAARNGERFHPSSHIFVWALIQHLHKRYLEWPKQPEHTFPWSLHPDRTWEGHTMCHKLIKRPVTIHKAWFLIVFLLCPSQMPKKSIVVVKYYDILLLLCYIWRGTWRLRACKVKKMYTIFCQLYLPLSPEFISPLEASGLKTCTQLVTGGHFKGHLTLKRLRIPPPLLHTAACSYLKVHCWVSGSNAKSNSLKARKRRGNLLWHRWAPEEICQWCAAPPWSTTNACVMNSI